MEKVRLISFRDVNPFVRYVHMSHMESSLHQTSVKAYDHRLMYVYDGKGFFLVDNVKYHVSKGSLLYWQSGTEYMVSPDESGCMTVIGVNFDFTSDRNNVDYPVQPEKAREFNSDNILEKVCFRDAKSFNSMIFIRNCHSLESILLEMKNEYVIRKDHYKTRINGLFLTLLADIARLTDLPSASSNDDENLTDRIIKFICKNYAYPLTNKDIASKFNYHINYINRMMVLNTGTSLHQYLINYRISGQSLLKTTINPSPKSPTKWVLMTQPIFQRRSRK